jgi:parallel beta-helix repeat protein
MPNPSRPAIRLRVNQIDASERWISPAELEGEGTLQAFTHISCFERDRTIKLFYLLRETPMVIGLQSRENVRFFLSRSNALPVGKCAGLFFGRAIFCFLLMTSAVYSQTIVVSPQGPIKTLVEARDAARAQGHSGTVGPITITIRAGTYYLPETLLLGPEDSNTIWEAQHGEHPVISGGRVISGWTKASGDVWTASALGPDFRELFVDGVRATRARTPNNGFFRMDGDTSPVKPFQLHYRGNDIRKEWANQQDVEVVAFLSWSDFRLPIVKVSEASRIATLSQGIEGVIKETDARYFLENSPDFLDAPGEWYLDRVKHTVFYIPLPNQDMQHATVEAPSLKRLVFLEGDPKSGALVRNVTFNGLTFVHADWTMDTKGYVDVQAAVPAPSAIEAVGAVNFKLDHCTIAHSGGYGIWLGRGSKHNQVVASEIFDMGAGGVKIGERVDRAADDEKNYANLVADNQIHDLGLVYAPAVGIWVLQSGQNQIVHNHVHDLFYTAISVGWTWGYGGNPSRGNLIAYNNLHDIGKAALSDMGGIYTLGEQPGTIIRNNLIHGVSSFTYGGWGIYMDEGSSDIAIEDNIVYDCKSAGFHQHYGRENKLRNNIFAFNHEYQLMRTNIEAHSSFAMENNIVYFNSGHLLGTNWADGHFTMRGNVYYDMRGAAISFAGKPFSEWQSSGQDRGSIIADPLFVNAGNFDFRLRPESPALKMGFHQIDMSTVGPRVRAGADEW